MLKNCSECGKPFEQDIPKRKLCPDCKIANRKKIQKKSYAEWYRNNKEKHKEYRIEYAKKNKKQIARKKQKYYQEVVLSNPIRHEKKLESNKKWFKENQNYPKEYKRKRYHNDEEYRQKEKERVKQWTIKNRDKKYVWNHNYFARKRNAEGNFTIEEWNKVLEKHNYRCANCHTTENLTRDHIRPLSKGGTNFISNIQPLCRSCNAKKSNKIVV